MVRSCAALGHEAGSVRPGLDRDRHHLVGRRHLEIQRFLDLGLEPRDVVVADVAAILAQMRGDAIRAGRDGEVRRPHRVGMPPTARVADGGDMVDVDAETQGGRRHAVLVLKRAVMLLGPILDAQSGDTRELALVVGDEGKVRGYRMSCNPEVVRIARYPFTRSTSATTALARNCAMMAVRCLRS